MSDPGLQGLAVLYLGDLIGTLIWAASYPMMIGHGKRYMTPRVFRALILICALMLLFFSLSLLYSTFLSG